LTDSIHTSDRIVKTRYNFRNDIPTDFSPTRRLTECRNQKSTRKLMKKNIWTIRLAALAALGAPLAAGSFALLHSNEASAQAVIIAPNAPPPPMRAEPPPPPRAGYAWDPGHWRWAGGQYVWAPGHWRAVRVGYHWVPGHWIQRGPHYRWVEGHWA
jgi:hypothetical protein